MEKLIDKLVRAHGTADPLLLARELGICVLYEALGSIRGYYNRQKKQKFIHINQDLNEAQMRFTAAHELGHALLHPAENVPFLREHTLVSTSRLEREANEFALRLLYRSLDEDLSRCSHSAAAALLGVSEQMLTRYTALFSPQNGAGFLQR